MSIRIMALRADIPVELPPKALKRRPSDFGQPAMNLEVWSDRCTVWDHATMTDCSQDYLYEPSDRDERIFGPPKAWTDMPGGRAKEQEIQRQFAHLRVSGEWFEAAPELLAHIAELTRSESEAQP